MLNKNRSIKSILLSIVIMVSSLTFGNTLSENNETLTQNTVGLIKNDGNSFDGFTLFAPLNSKVTYLVDNDGLLVHSWESENNPGNSVYLLENGNLLRTQNLKNREFTAGGIGGEIVEMDWDGNVIWNYEYDSIQYAQHHDIELLPNGNILLIAWELKSTEEAIEQGRNPNLLKDDKLWADHIIEIQPTGDSGGNIVWEWHVWDHLIQDYDSTKSNFGVVSEHPELINLNFSTGAPNKIGQKDWNHTNSIDYNEELDQIILSIHAFSEIWIIDHSTTTEQAASHTDGQSGKGGDLLYRWGNPQAYNRGNSDDQKLFKQHDAHWIEDGLHGAGNILIFNNGQNRNYSSIDEIIPPVNENVYDIIDGASFGPVEAVWTFISDNPTDFYGQNISGVQRLENGNTLICEGPTGRFFEIDSDNNIIWEYINPDGENGIMTQGDIPKKNAVFRCTKYSTNYSGFEGKELNGENPIEFYPEEEDTSDNYNENSYVIVSTGQDIFYDNSNEISTPESGDPFYGQDAQFEGNQPSYKNNDDGTVTDLNTGLMWQEGYNQEKLSFDDGIAGADTFSLGGYDDWRVPTIKELYSLIMFYGLDPSGWNGSDVSQLTPFIDTSYFNFRYGIVDDGQRIIDAQYMSSTQYVSTTMNNNETVFGVNFADGRIKGYPSGQLQNGSYKTYEVKYVRGNTDYGINNFQVNNDSTITDIATCLMWTKNDSKEGLNWEEAFAFVQAKNDENYLGYSDWRLPDIKELQSVLDYTRSPETTSSAALDPVFNVSSIVNAGGETDYPFYWSGTTHANMSKGTNACYCSFGRALGWMGGSNGADYTLLDVHGAGAQRSDPKEGDPNDWLNGHGPQGDVIRIFNYVRLVRNAEVETSINEENSIITPLAYSLSQNYPNPFNPTTQIEFQIPKTNFVKLEIFNILGQKVETLVNKTIQAGIHRIEWNAVKINSGVYFYKISTSEFIEVKKCIFVK